MLLALLLIYFQVGTTDLQVLFVSEFSERRQLLLWLAFFASFCKSTYGTYAYLASRSTC